MSKYRVIVFILILLCCDNAYALLPTPIKNVTVRSYAACDSGTGLYSYRYSIYNPPSNGLIDIIQIDIRKPTSAIELSSEGLIVERGININSNTVLYHTFNEEVAQMQPEKEVVPVGVKIGDRNWGGAVTAMGTVMWGGSETTLIMPGQTLGGFTITSYGLPGIRDGMVEPDIDYDNLPDEYWGNVELTKQLQDSLVYHIKTIGPTAPPADFKPADFLTSIINMKHDAYNLGWIKNEGTLKSLDAKLENAKKDIEKGNIKSAKNTLKAFINEVEAQGCESYENCPDGKHLTSEAYALLKYNAQYLIDHF